MAKSNSSIGVIILGNSGVGKSFLANVILGREAFKHKYQVNAVTIKTEYQESVFMGLLNAVYNIPGLIEADQERINLNIDEIDLAFRQHPNAVVVYVFGTNNGRLRNEDIVAFNAINRAYPLSQKSLVVVVNGVNPNRLDDYEAETATALSNHLKMHLPYICFVNQINEPSEKEPLRQQLLQTITSAVPKIHNKVQEINLQAAEISKLTKQIADFQKQIEQDREKHRLEVEKLKKEFEQKERQEKVEQEEFRLRVDKELQENRKRLEDQSQKLKAAQVKIAPVWQSASDGHVPANAVVGGFDKQGALYVARFTNGYGQLAPGKLNPANKLCYNGCAWEECSSRTYEVLTHPTWQEAFRWVATTGGHLPVGALQGGVRSDVSTEPLYVCRGSVNGSLIPGKFHPGSGGAYLPYGGKEHFVTSCEVLVWIAFC